ncbi:DNA mismatch repair protein MSH6 isoform X2 [Malania oleifera]|uniref:DNA mismatch repair protein MSH6 isoform X2 n=1 Tax=Malania oleifera TaxID=397392 RepID=UPI0025ADAF59|nr:DNA mismatch repair protein MSH6 isoform X2 [Malania oleifera]
MAPSRRLSNGRSPLVNQQSQITAFFSKSSSSSSPTLSKKSSNPNPNASSSPSPSPSPTTPSPVQSKHRKPLLLVGPSPTRSPPAPASDTATTPDVSRKSYGEEVVGRRIRVYWPLDQSWYEGCVKSFDKIAGKHLVQYDDSEEEVLVLSKEKIEWVEVSAVRRFRRLRRASVVEEENVEQEEENVEQVEEDSGGDDSTDEDWGKNVADEGVEDESEYMELEDEDEEVKDEVRRSKGTQNKNLESKKRRTIGGENSCSSKKNKSGGQADEKGLKVMGVNGGRFGETTNVTERMKASHDFESVLVGDAAERFGLREAEKLPFLGKDLRDAKRRRPGHENYDPKTLYLPPDFLKSLSGGQRQWWDFKSKNMDKVLFFKMGKFYELFEMDAHIAAKELDLQYMKGEQPHCGFPEKNFSMNVEKLARKGYRVLVVEQTETPEQLELRRKEKGSKDKVVKREICAVVTKGTLTEGEMLLANPEASYMIAVTERCPIPGSQKEERIFGVCVVDVATNRTILGQFGDDSECSALCCLLTELRPVEIIKPSKLLSSETERMLLGHTRNPLVNELVPLLEFWDAERTVCEVKRIYKNVDGEDGSCALSALGGTLFYLKQAFLDETLLRFGKFELLPCSRFSDITQIPYMVLDAAALENLEIFENSRNGDSSGTLYAQLNHCVTAFGKRLLKTWLARPLFNLRSIRERQDGVAGLRGVNLPFALEFRKELSRLPDMERLLAHLFASSKANGRNANKVVLYEDAAKKQLNEFISALRGCELMAQACSSLGAELENVKSELLNNLLTPGKGLPDVCSILKHFKEAFDWVEASDSGRIIPHEGVDAEYDSACEAVKEVENSFKKHLKEQRKLLGDSSINYVTVGKESHLLEVPESLRGTVPRNYELRSSKKGFFRYWNADIKRLLGELSQAESEKESKLKSILQRLIGRFCEHHNEWRQLVSAIAELDVLISLAIASDFYEGPTCRPVVSGLASSNEVPYCSAKSLGHPILRSDSLGKGTFVPNDITIGGSGNASFILLTGPNMGGKSTLLRQVCLAVILAQVGADVPAENFELSLVDRIFVRMGAKDHIVTGQSTFLTELSETACMLSSATCNSLVALDELGRGTSTSDGQAIAESVLEHFVRMVQCRGMFSTHYHRLAISYQRDPKVSLCHMACQVGQGDGVEEVAFLYKLTPGACPKSYGVNVARLAGLPDSVLKIAAAKSREFEAVYGKKGRRTVGSSSIQGQEEEMLAFMQNFVSAAAKLSCHSSKNASIGILSDLQHQARMLLQQY